MNTIPINHLPAVRAFAEVRIAELNRRADTPENSARADEQRMIIAMIDGLEAQQNLIDQAFGNLVGHTGQEVTP